MKRLVGAMLVFFFFTLTLPAFAEEPTVGQLNELDRLVAVCKANTKTAEACLKVLRMVAVAATAVTDTFTVEVRCNLSEAVEAGKYNWVNKHITPKSFPVPKGCVEGERVKVLLFSPQNLGEEDGYITTREAITEMGKRKCRPVDWTLLLPLGDKYPELQRKFWIVGLGFAWQRPGGSVNVPILGGRDGQRGLSLYWVGPDYRWSSDNRLAASCE